MDRGFVLLWRKSLDSRIFQNAELWQLWTWCLMKANHSPKFCEMVTGKGRSSVLVNTGSFIFGRNQAAKELGQKPSGLWKRCLLLQRLGNVNIQSDSHYSIISIVNWETYQEKPKKSNRQGDRQVTGKEQPSDTNNNYTTIQKEEKTKEKDMGPSRLFRYERARQLPDDFLWGEQVQKEAEKIGVKNPEFEFAGFQDYYRANGKTHKDWLAAWRTWCRNDVKRNGASSKAEAPPDSIRTLTGRYLTGSLKTTFEDFRRTWNNGTPHDLGMNKAADVWLDLPWTKDAEQNKALLSRILSGARKEADGRPWKKDNGKTPVSPTTWLQEERWGQYDYQPPAKTAEKTPETGDKKVNPEEWEANEKARLEAMTLEEKSADEKLARQNARFSELVKSGMSFRDAMVESKRVE